MCTYPDNVARHAQRVKLCNGATCHVEHGINQMPFKTVYAATHGQQSHGKNGHLTLCNVVQHETRCRALQHIPDSCAVWLTHHVAP